MVLTKSIYIDSNQFGTGDALDILDNLGCLIISEDEIRDAVTKLKVNNSVATDKLPAYIIKGCIDSFVKSLKYIFNLCLGQAVYPNKWKESKVIPIFKSGDKNEIYNYRCCFGMFQNF